MVDFLIRTSHTPWMFLSKFYDEEICKVVCTYLEEENDVLQRREIHVVLVHADTQASSRWLRWASSDSWNVCMSVV